MKRASVLFVLAGSTVAMGQGTLVTIPPHQNVYNGFSRGFNFTASVPFTISRLELPPEAMQAGDTAGFLVRINGAVALRSVGNAGSFITPNVAVNPGDVVDIIGNWSPAVTGSFTAHNSYAASGDVNTTIEGVPHVLRRTGWQYDIADPNWQSASYLAPTTGQIGRILMYTMPQSNDPGACCFATGSCSFIAPTDCINQGGVFQGAGVTCAQANCPQPGPCCVGGSCTMLLPSACAAQGGIAQAGASCAGVVCPAAWAALPAAPEARSRPGGAMVGNTFYYMGGEPQNTTAWKIEVPAGAWTPIASLPPVAGGTGGVSNIDAAALGTDIYIAGGWDGATPYNRLIRYDTVADAWSEVTTDPVPTTIYANTLVAHNNKLYLFGGSVATGLLNTQGYVYDPAAPAGTRWSTVPGPATARQYAGAAVIDGKIYLTGGIGASTLDEYNSAEVFDPSTNSWSALPAMSVPRGGGAAYNHNGQLLAVAGGWATYRNTAELLDNNTWQAHVNVNFGARTFAYDGNASFLVKAGGWSGAYLNNAEYLPLTTGSACYANCDNSTQVPFLNVADFGCFLGKFAAGDLYANCDGSTQAPVLNVADFGCFLTKFAAGCSAP